MRRFLLLTLGLFVSTLGFGQVYEDCAGAEADVQSITSFPYTQTFTSLGGDEGDYDPSSMNNGFATTFIAISVDVTLGSGNYDITIVEDPGNPGLMGEISIGMVQDCGQFSDGSDDLDEIAYIDDVQNTMISGCNYLQEFSTYIIVISTENGYTGDMQLTIDGPNLNPPANDQCMGPQSAEDVPGSLSTNNNCATADGALATSCGLDMNSSHTTWYSYDKTAATAVDLTITFAGSGGTADAMALSTAFYSDCAGTPINGTLTSGNDLCNAFGSTFTFECVSDATIFFAVGSPDGSEGNFDITIVEGSAAPTNDVCDDGVGGGATDLGTLPACASFTASVDNADACPESFSGSAGCNFTMGAVVWYSITTPVGATALEVSGLSGAYMGLFASCDPTSQINDCIADAGGTLPVSENTTYYIATTQTAAEGPYSFELLAVVPPTNSDCNTPDVLTNASGTDGTNACAGPLGYCGLDGNTSHWVYYQYTKVATGAVDLQIEIAGGTGTTSDATAISLGFFTDCPATMGLVFSEINGEDECAMTIGDSRTFDCVTEATFYIAVGSPDGSEGEFNITVTELNPAPANDVCTTPEIVPDLGSCVWETISTNNTNACPEVFASAAAGCDFQNDPTTWYQITVPAGATELNFQMFASGNAPYIGVFTNCSDTPTQLGDCLTGDGDININGQGTTFLLAIGQDDAPVDPFTFQIKANVPPANDLCADAEPLAAGGPIPGTTNCASNTLTSTTCATIDTDAHDVYYTYTNGTGGNVDLDITITFAVGSTNQAMTGASLFALTDACNGTLYDANSEFCDITDGTASELLCVEAGATVIFMVSSADGAEGDFTIEIAEDTDQPVDNNDECDLTPRDITPADECTWTEVTGSTLSACPEDFAPIGACDFDMQSTVWYQVNAPTTGNNMSLEIRNIAGTGTGFATVFSDISNCDSPTALQANDGGPTCLTGADVQAFDIAAGGSLWIAFGDDTPGDHTFDIRIVTPPINDICTPDAIALTDETPLDGTTACATPDPISFCGLSTTDDHVVYYTYTVPAGNNGDLTISIATGTGVTGDAAGAISMAVWTDCTGATDFTIDNPPAADNRCAMLDNNLEFSCIEPGTEITIAVGSPDMSEGDFQITVDWDDSMTPDNDACDMAEVVTITADCAWQTITGDNTGACPEDFAGSACDFDGDNVVWYSVELGAGGTGFEFRMFGTDTYVGVFDNDCDNLTLAGGSDCFDTDGQLLGLTPGTYLIGVGLAGMAEGSYNFDIKTVVPPANDMCIPDAENIPDGNPVEGTTKCATPWTNDICNVSMDNGHVVYYTYTVQSTINTDLAILIAGSTNTTGEATTDASIAVWTDCNGTDYTLDNPIVNGDPCSTLGIPVTFECVEPNTVLTIAVGSPNTLDGDFTITITEDNTETPPNDGCVDAEPIIPTDDCVYITVDVDNEGACPEDFPGSSCDFDGDKIVWFSIEIPAGGTGLEFQDLSPGLYVGIFNNDCTNLSLASADCVIGDEQVLGLAPGTYLLGVGNDGMDEATDYTFNVKTIVPPANDLPCNAEAVDDAGGIIMANNDCATQEFTDPDCDPQSVSSVYYLYTVPAGTNGLVIGLTDTGDGSDFMLGVYDFNGDCSSTPSLFNDITSICDADGEEIELTCIDEGDEIYIIVSSASDDAGTFDLEVTPVVPDPLCIDNDACDDPAVATSDIAFPITDGGQICVTDCNLNACPEDFDFGVDCDYGVLPTVFYQITLDGMAGMGTLSASLTGVGANPIDPVFTIFEACNDLTPLPGAECITNGGVTNLPVINNGVYIIAVADGNIDDGIIGGEFRLCVQVVTSCNDDPCSPAILESGVVPDCMTNIGSTEDYTTDEPCGDEDITLSSVYFTYTGTPGLTSATITVTSTGAGDDISGVTSLIVFENPDDCGDITTFTQFMIDSDCNVPTTPLEVVINCPVVDQQYLIQVATNQGDEGDFEIMVVERFPDPTCTKNDICDEANVLDATINCVPLSTVGCNREACPEQFTDPNFECFFDESAVVWYTFTTNDLAFAGTFEIVGSGADPLQDISFGIFSDTGCSDDPDPVDPATFCITDPAEVIDLPLDPNTTYYIAVGSTTMSEGEFTINYQIDSRVSNDEPCETDQSDGPLDLTGIMTHDGTTCCARGFEDLDANGNPLDYENVAPCNNATAENAVWYIFTPEENVDGYEVNVTGGSVQNQMGVQIYAGADDTAGCSPFTADDVVGSSCVDLNASIRFANCDPDVVYYIKVMSADQDCGEFNITVGPATGCPGADECEDSEVLLTETPSDCEEGEITMSVEGCLDLACPEEITNCGHDMGPTVWFQIDIDSDEASALVTQVDAPGFDVVWSIFEGTSCDALTPVAEPDGPGNAFACSDSDGDPSNNHVTPIGINPDNMQPFSYWIAITAIGDIDDPNFTLNYGSSLGCISCSGEDAFDCDNGDFAAFVNGVESEGPFCPGDEVEVCIEFTYDATLTGNDWMHGIIPNFGLGWDLDQSDLAGANIGGNFEWFDEQGGCAPYLNGYGLPNVCTYTENGVLKMCNTACDLNCPCEGPLEDGSPLPSGWFWNSGGGLSTCNLNCSPASFYGIPSGNFVMVDVCIPLKVKIFEPGECEENQDLQITFQTTSDAVSGCWVDQSPCIIDPALQGPPWMVECDTPPNPIADPEPICSGEEAGLEINQEDGGSYLIEVTFEDNPAVEGEGTDIQWIGTTLEFPNGFGTINDILINQSGSIQEVKYIARVITTDFVCPGPEVEFIVEVYPELEVEFIPNPDFVCPTECTNISPNVSGGTGNFVNYEWSTSQTGISSIEVCPLVETEYMVTVTDDAGCTGVGTVVVQVKEELVFEICNSQSFDCGVDLFLCKDGVNNGLNGEYVVTPLAITGDLPIAYTFLPEIGLEGFVTSDGSQFIINEEDSQDFDQDGLELCIQGVSTFGCDSVECITIFIFDEPQIEIIEEDLNCGSTLFGFTVTATFPNGAGPVPNVIIRSCDGVPLYDEIGSTTGLFLPPLFDLNEQQCFEIVAFDDASGCEVVQILNKTPVFGTPIEISDVTVCEGEEAVVVIDNSADYTDYDWTAAGSTTFSHTNASFTFIPDSTTTFFITTEDADGCTAEATATVTVNPNPVVNLEDEFTFCPGSSATAEVSGGVTYEWVNTADGSVVGTMATYESTVEGTFEVTVTDSLGCSGTAMTTFVERNQVTINILGSDLCDGAQTELSFAGDFNNVVWSTDAGATVLANDIDSIFVTAGGTYDVVAEDPSGCPAAGTITIQEFSTPVLDLPDVLDVCRDDSGVDSIFINFASLVTGISGTWSQLQAVPATFVPPFDNVSFEGVPAGPYQFVFATNTAESPCVDQRDTVTINVKSCPCPSVDVRDPAPICNDGGLVDLDGASVKLTGEPGVWTVESGPGGQDLTTLITGSVFAAPSGTLAGDYGVLFTLNDQGGPNCQIDSLITVTVIDGPELSTVATGRICNITGGTDPTTIDLNTLISTNTAGVWTDAAGDPVADPTNIDGTTFGAPFPQTLSFTFTTTLPTDSPCNDVSTVVEVLIRDCNCPFYEVADTTICNSASAIDLTQLLDNPDNLSGTWSSVPSGPVTGSMFDPSGLSSQGVEIIFTLASSPGPNCPLADTALIGVVNQPSLTLTPQAPPCNEDTGNGPTSVNLYDWLDAGTTDGDWTQTSGPAITIDVVSDSEANVEFAGTGVGTTFEFTFTTNSIPDPPCMNISEVVTITVGDCMCPPIELTAPDTLCNQGGILDLAVLIGGSDPGVFQLLFGGNPQLLDGGTMFDYTDAQPGTYELIYTLDQIVTGNCVQRLDTQFVISEYREVMLDPTYFEVCNNSDPGNTSTVDFTAFLSGLPTGTWTDLDGAGVDLTTLITSVDFDGLDTLEYRFQYEIENDYPCPNSTGIVTIKVTDCSCPIANPGNPAVECITPTNNMIDLTEYDDPDQPGMWSSPDFTVTNGVLDATGAAAGNYTVTYTIDLVPDDPSCQTEWERTLMLVVPAEAGVGRDTSVCVDDNAVITLTDLITGGEAAGSWTEIGAVSGGLDGLAATFNTTGLSAGVYELQYGFEANGECPEDFAFVNITVEALPMADAGTPAELNCDFPTAEIGGTGTSTGATFSYLWEELENGVELVDPTLATQTVSAAGLYQLTVTNTETGCTETSTVRITESDDKPSMLVEATDVICFGEANGFVSLSMITGGDGDYSYSFNGGPFITFEELQLTNLDVGSYTIEIRDGKGCSTEYPFVIEQPSSVAVDIVGGAVVTGELGGEFTFTIEPFDTTGITSIIWTDGEGNVVGTDVTSITVSPMDPITNYTVVVSNANDCSATDAIQLQLTQNIDITFPNIINPNSDAGNTVFYINDDDVELIRKLLVYDRWGALVFSGESLPPNDPSVGWDATFQGKAVVPGVFVFYIEVDFVDGSEEAFSGDITVNR